MWMLLRVHMTSSDIVSSPRCSFSSTGMNLNGLGDFARSSGKSGAGWVAIREAGLEQRYAGLYLRHNDGRSFYSTIAPHPDDDSVGVILVAPFDTPWRVFSLGADAASVLNSNLPQRLSNLETHPDTSGWPHVAWTKLQADMTGTLAGITAKGVVVDTPVRDDQEMLTFYKTASDAAARRQLGIEFTGRRRTGTLTLRGDSLEIRK